MIKSTLMSFLRKNSKLKLKLRLKICSEKLFFRTEKKPVCKAEPRERRGQAKRAFVTRVIVVVEHRN